MPLGELDDGTKVSLLDAQWSNFSVFIPSNEDQQFSGWRIVRGVHVADLHQLGDGVRWIMPTPIGLRGKAKIEFDQGTFETWDSSSGVQLRYALPRSIAELADVIPHRMCAFYRVACGLNVRPLRREILIGPQWCPYGVDTSEPLRPRDTDLHDRTVTPDLLVAWENLSRRLGTIPFHVNMPRSTLEVDLHGLAATFESLHRHLYKDEKPFNASKSAVKNAVRVAADAGADQLSRHGVNKEYAKQRFSEALGHAGQMSYKERLKVIVEPIQSIAPGLFGPSLDEWIKQMKDVRNSLSHGLPARPGTDDNEELRRHIVLVESGRWALRLAILLQMLDPGVLSGQLRRSLAFKYSLANIDQERWWENFSAAQRYAIGGGGAPGTYP